MKCSNRSYQILAQKLMKAVKDNNFLPVHSGRVQLWIAIKTAQEHNGTWLIRSLEGDIMEHRFGGAVSIKWIKSKTTGKRQYDKIKMLNS